MSERKLATIRRISEINPIQGADSIEVATVDGWKVVVKKGEFKVNDMAVYLEIDSWVPTELAPFLSKGKEPREFNGVKGEKLRTIKLKGQVSQGLLLPIEVAFPDADRYFWYSSLGKDVTSQLGIQKWEAPISQQLAGQVKGNFPSFLQKTDQGRAQNLIREIRTHVDAGTEFEITVKLDGSSMTVFHNNGEFGVCSRNLQLKINDENKDNSFVRVAIDGLFNIVLPSMGNYAVQGELMGPGIQGNREGLASHKMFIFDIFNIDEFRYLTPVERMEFVDKLIERGINQNIVSHVPIIGTSKLISGEVDDLLKFAEGPSLNHPIREGLVYKQADGQFSFKTISNKYLLSEKS